MGVRTPRAACHARRLRHTRLRPRQPARHTRHLHARPPSGKDGQGLQARQRRGVADQDRRPAIQGKRTDHRGDRRGARGRAYLPIVRP